MYVHDIQRVEMFPLTHGMQLKTIWDTGMKNNIR